MEKLGGLFDCLCIYYLHDKDSTILYNNYIHNFWGGKLENKFVQTWYIFEPQKPQVVFDDVFSYIHRSLRMSKSCEQLFVEFSN